MAPTWFSFESLANVTHEPKAQKHKLKSPGPVEQVFRSEKGPKD